ncbi:hypothetical protein K402DRAFT_351203 [Aulographum hederae CBS 113979]|uniref:Uncharacterized protein n=1 Tax=Aulographum hederae CBS 113979 TaxID=1176131 RepID=A0A6G1H6T3_9PEZI|nr:hypothetical protein K402DRAFT_351203 [Aulographum hederae CBS 113979]
MSTSTTTPLPKAPNSIILFHYHFSPYARRIVHYLTLRHIPYAQCLVTPIMPRPSLAALTLSYRRIPVLAIESTIYIDTRLILRVLETMDFPDALPPLSSRVPPQMKDDYAAMQILLSRWVVDAGVFMRAVSLMPADLPNLSDPRFIKDREEFAGRPWGSREARERGKPESVVAIGDVFGVLEGTLLRDGREWLFKTEGPSMGDIEAFWPLDWLLSMPSALPETYISATTHPKTFAWIHRFRTLFAASKKSLPKPLTLSDADAPAVILSHVSSTSVPEAKVDPTDPLGLKAGEEVLVWPIDTGASGRERGALVRLGPGEVVVRKGNGVLVAFPRWGFRVVRAGKVEGKGKL